MQRRDEMMFRIRDVKETDSKTLWEWANDPVVRAASFSTDPITWESHVEWFQNKMKDPNYYIYMIESSDGGLVGQVRFEIYSDRSSTVSLSVSKEWRGKGQSSSLLKLACDTLKMAGVVDKVNAFIKKDNAPSLKAFKLAGFESCGDVTVKDIPAIKMTKRLS